MRWMMVAACAGLLTGAPAAHAQGASAMDCGAVGAAQIRTTLYFGTLRPRSGGTVTERDWRDFLRHEVTPRFPDGLTTWDAEGQWRDGGGRLWQEPSRILVLLHPETDRARKSIQALIAAFKKKFDHDSVLWESARVCVAG